MAHLWAKWLRHPCRLGDPHRFRARGQNQKWPTCGQSGYVTPAGSGIPTAAERRGGNQKWPTSGQSGYVTPAVSGIPTTSERGANSEVAHLWAKWLRHPCRLGDPHRLTAGGKIRSGPLVGKVATSPLPSRGSPPLQSAGAKSEVAHLWAKWLRHPCRHGDPHRFKAGGKIRSGPLVGKVATSPLPSRGSPPLHSGGQNQKWPTCGQSGYVTPAVSGIPTAAERGGKSEMAHLWAKWLRHPCRLGDPHRFRAGGKIRSGPLVGKVATSPLPSRGSPPLQSGGQNRSGPLVGKVATSPLPSRGSPPLQSGGQNQKWPTCGQSGYATPAVSGIPTAAERGGKSEMAHLWAKWLRHPCRLGDPHRFRARGQNQKWPTCGQSGYVTPAGSGIPTAAERRGGNQKWPTSGQSGYVTPAVSGIPTTSERGANSEVAHLWAKWLRHPCRLGDPHRQRGAKSEVAHLWAKWLRHPCRLGDPHRFRARGQNQKWPTCGQSGYVTPAVTGIPTALKRGAKSEVAHLWAKWLRHPCRLGDPHRFTAGGKIRSGPLVGKVATSPLPSRGSPPLQSGGGNQKWPTCGQSGYATPAVSGIPTASERGAKSEVAHLWAKWLRHPCRLGDPHRCKASVKVRQMFLPTKFFT